MWARASLFLGISSILIHPGCTTSRSIQGTQASANSEVSAVVDNAPEFASVSTLPDAPADEEQATSLALVQHEDHVEEPAPYPRVSPGKVDSADTVIEWDVPADSAEGEAYDLPFLLSLASANNPTLRQARLQVSGTLAQAQQAGLYPNPTLMYLGENINSGGTPGEFQGVELEQRIVTADKLELSRNKYLQRAKVAEHHAVAQQFKVCNDVKLHYIAVLEAQSLLEIEQELLKTAVDQLVTVKELHNLGQANEVDLRQTNAELRRQQLAVLSAQNRVRQEFYRLTAVVGVELTYRPLSGSLGAQGELIQFHDAYARILSESPEILAAYSKLREDHITVHREKVEWVPDILISGGSGYNFESQDAVANTSVRLEVPLYDWNQGTIRQAEADEQRQRLEIRRVEMMLRRQLADQYERYLSAIQAVENYESTVLPEFKTAYEVALKSYREDRQDWPDVLDAHTKYTQRRMEYIHNLGELSRAEVLIAGYLLENGLEAAPNPTPPGHIDSTPKPR